MDTKKRHSALIKLRSLCGKTAEEFSQLTGIGYAQLVAVEQGRRELSPSDALLVTAATGVNPRFNENKSILAVKTLWGTLYDQNTLSYWQEIEVPKLRGQLSDLSEGNNLVENVIIHNVREILASAQVLNRDLAVALYLASNLESIVDRFNLKPSLASWSSFEFCGQTHSEGGPRNSGTFSPAEGESNLTAGYHLEKRQGLGRLVSEFAPRHEISLRIPKEHIVKYGGIRCTLPVTDEFIERQMAAEGERALLQSRLKKSKRGAGKKRKA